MLITGILKVRVTYQQKGKFLDLLIVRDEDRMARSVTGFNSTVNALREEIERQKVYHDKIQNLEKKHLKGIPGIQ